MFSDPQSVTIATVAKSLPRVTAPVGGGRFANSDRSIELVLSHTSGRRKQDKTRLNKSKIVTDPLASDRNLPVSMSVYAVADYPLVGFTVAEVVAELIALADWLKVPGNADRLVGGEA